MDWKEPQPYKNKHGALRGDVLWRIDRFFQREMSIEERVLQSVEVISRDSGFSKSQTLLKNAIIFYPAIACLIEELLKPIGDYNLISQKLVNISTRQYVPENDRKHVRRLLQACFWDKQRRTRNNFGNKIRNSGQLTMYDMLIGTSKKAVSNPVVNPIVGNAYKKKKPIILAVNIGIGCLI